MSRGWEKFLHESTLAPLVTIALARYHFEAVHLFLDGNGRVGRLLMTLFLIERHILPHRCFTCRRSLKHQGETITTVCAGLANAGRGTIGWSISCWESPACLRML